MFRIPLLHVDFISACGIVSLVRARPGIAPRVSAFHYPISTHFYLLLLCNGKGLLYISCLHHMMLLACATALYETRQYMTTHRVSHGLHVHVHVHVPLLCEHVNMQWSGILLTVTVSLCLQAVHASTCMP